MTGASGYLVRAVRWQPVLPGAVGGLVFLAAARLVGGSWVAAALLFAGAAIAAGLAFCLDDAAGETLACVPVTHRRRALAALGVATGIGASCWAVLLVLAVGGGPLWHISAMAAGLTAVGWAVAANARRRLGPVNGGRLGAVTTVGLGLGASTIPDPWALSPGHAGMVGRWGLLGALGVAAVLWGVRDPAGRFG